MCTVETVISRVLARNAPGRPGVEKTGHETRINS